MLLIYLAPVFICFELFQLLVAERYIGVKRIREGVHPLDAKQRLPEWMAAMWVIGRILTWLYLILLVFDPRAGLQGFIMIVVTILATGLRRALGLKWALVIMTIEGSIRMGMLANILMTVFLFDGRLIPQEWYQRG